MLLAAALALVCRETLGVVSCSFCAVDWRETFSLVAILLDLHFRTGFGIFLGDPPKNDH